MSHTDDQSFLFDDDGAPAQPVPAAPKKTRKTKSAAKVEAPLMVVEEVEADAPAAPPAAPPHESGGAGFGDGPLHRLIDDNFLQYASYVIRDRAIPEIRDGLKPVQRRVLYVLHKHDDGHLIKVANIMGATMPYHPHGDQSIGDALVALVNRGHLIEGQGNFGNIHTGDPAAAPRYIECRLTDLASTQLFNSDLTEFIPTYDSRNKEPVVLPAKIPLLLMLGADGIAVGLSTKILPHNFGELLQAQIAILRNKPFKILPDFQQGGIMDVREYDEGRGRIRVRAVIDQADESTLVIRELAYGTTTESLIASIEKAVKAGKFKINSINDLTSDKVEIHLKLPSGAQVATVLKALYAFTECEKSIVLSPIVIKDQRPVEMSVHDILRFNTTCLVDLLQRELEIERGKIIESLHRSSLVRLFITKRIYKNIEECKTADAVKQAILDGLAPYRKQLRRDITAADMDMLLGIPIRRISLYDIKKSKLEEDNLLEDLKATEKALSSVTAYTIQYLKNLLRDYSDVKRRTREEAFDTIEMRALTEKEITIFRDKAKGYIGTDASLGEAEFKCSSLDKLILVWKDGRYRVIPPPEKLFVDKDLLYLGVYDRDKEMLLVYTAGAATNIKKFTFGGVIQNKEYNLLPEEGKIIYFSASVPEQLFVVYAPRKGQQIHQQVFATAPVALRGVKSRGVRMTTKKVASIGHTKPRSWDDKAAARGALLDFI